MIGNFNFEQLDDVLQNGSILPYEVYRGCLRMDGKTMANLEIFSNNVDGGTSGKFSVDNLIRGGSFIPFTYTWVDLDYGLSLTCQIK